MPKPKASSPKPEAESLELGPLATTESPSYEQLAQDLVEGLAHSVSDDDAEAPTDRASVEATNGDGAADHSDEQREVLRRISMLERDNELLRAQLTGSPSKAKPEPDPFKPPEIQTYEGYESFQEGEYNKRIANIYHELDRLQRQNAELVTELRSSRRETDFDSFKRDHQDWQDYEQDMLDIADRLGTLPKNYKGLTELYQTAKERREITKLRQAERASRNAGPVPRSNGSRTVLRDRMEAGSGKRALSIEESLRDAARQMVRRG
jgi:hypothetical protein